VFDTVIPSSLVTVSDYYYMSPTVKMLELLEEKGVEFRVIDGPISAFFKECSDEKLEFMLKRRLLSYTLRMELATLYALSGNKKRADLINKYSIDDV